jgi:hypothetical protein
MKKFIKTMDKPTADKLKAAGFKLVSEIGGVYTFFNEIPKNFNFEVIDTKKIVYDNILSL